ncbi:hypothetical protein GH714_005192 [Hevea brasiliensis]|uniref:Pentatricopeptide repeat-containing protein n=1 Tax=Hevea brasiliensis TaxID=3981 RepID=A0A6A6KH60_HEVBR|nr:hypothetical protein GH714_005192 [Hevea brasiliensis]
MLIVGPSPLRLKETRKAISFALSSLAASMMVVCYFEVQRLARLISKVRLSVSSRLSYAAKEAIVVLASQIYSSSGDSNDRQFCDLDSVVQVFDDMLTREQNVNPSEVTFASVLRACGGGNTAFCYVEQIHARMICHGFVNNPIACNPLIDLYAKNGFIDSARKVFDKLCVKDSVSWVAMISGFSQNGYGEEAIRLFYEMHISGIFPTPYVFSGVLSACTKGELFDTGEQLHALVFKFGFCLETYVCNALITLYSRMGNFMSAEQVFGKIQSKDEVSYNSLISGLAQQGCSDRALKLFKKMQLDHLKPDCVTIASLISACASIGALSKGRTATLICDKSRNVYRHYY